MYHSCSVRVTIPRIAAAPKVCVSAKAPERTAKPVQILRAVPASPTNKGDAHVQEIDPRRTRGVNGRSRLRGAARSTAARAAYVSGEPMNFL